MAYLLNGSIKQAKEQIQQIFDHDVNKGKEALNEICDHLLDPTKIGERTDLVEWIKALMSGGESFETFCQRLQSMDISPFCGCVWTADFVAYRCRTCANSPSMSLCAACFERGNHEGHDYNIFRSEAGGACDCGDPSVLKESGFCLHHGTDKVPPLPVPPGYLSAAEVLLDRLFLMFIHILRKYSQIPDQNLPTFNPEFPHEILGFFSLMLDLSKLGSQIRTHIYNLLTDEKLYPDLRECKGYKCVETGDSPYSQFHKESNAIFQTAVKSIKPPRIPPEIKDSGQFKRAFQYLNYLDEITFWIIRYEFPECVILILLNLLPDANMKKEFSMSFTRHYSRIAASLGKSAKLDQLSNRVVHISVQLFSNDDLAYMLTTEESLLEIFIISLHNIIFPNLTSSETNPNDYHQCVAGTESSLRTNAYWPVVSDFVNVLSHARVTTLLLSNVDLMSCLVQQLLCFCGMDLTNRELETHVGYETSSILLAFHTERDVCASPLWCFVDALTNRSTAQLSIGVVSILCDALTELFDALGFDGDTTLPYNQISFHYPLHRYLAYFISNAITNQGVHFKDFFIAMEELIKIFEHPLHVLVTMYEIQSGMWVRNGLALSTQALAYKQYFFCTFFIDADLYLLQLCSSFLPPNYVVAKIFERCRVTNCLTAADSVSPYFDDINYSHLGAPDEDRQPKMLESAFKLLMAILGIRTHLGMNYKEIIDSDMIVLLTSQPSTYSSISDHVLLCNSAHNGSRSNEYADYLPQALSKYANKKEGDAMEQTKYTPNSTAWSKYDPLFNSHRILYKKVIQQAHVSYLRHLKSEFDINSKLTDTSIWPPFQPITEFMPQYSGIKNLVHCKRMHMTIYTILFKALHNHTLVTDMTLAMALHILEAGFSLKKNLTDPSQKLGNKKLPLLSILNPEEQDIGIPTFDWFTSDDITINSGTMVTELKVPPSNREPTPRIVSYNEELMETESTSSLNLFTSKGIEINKSVKTNESILSLLVKLYNKLNDGEGLFILDEDKVKGYGRSTPIPPTRANVIENVLLAAAKLSKENENTIKVIANSLNSKANTDSNSERTEAELKAYKRQQAKEARQRLMKQFAEKQKKFSECNQMEIERETQEPPQDDSKEQMYECVICGVQESCFNSVDNFDKNKLIGLICLVQPSLVLGHRRNDNLVCNLSSTSNPDFVKNTHVYVSNKMKESKVMLELPISSETDYDPTVIGGIHISTCGHSVHLSCHREYMLTVSKEVIIQTRLKHQFQCPLCRQVSNLVLPQNITNNDWVPNDGVVKPYITLTCYEMIAEIFERCNLKESPEVLPDPIPLMYASVFYNLEHNLMQMGDTLLMQVNEQGSSSSLSPMGKAFQRKLPIGTMFNILYHICRVAQPQNTAIKSTYNFLTSEDGSSSDHHVPVLMQDFVLLLVKFTTNGPLTLEKFYKDVQILYQLAFVKSLIHLSFQFSPEERRAWKNSIGVSLGGIPFCDSNFECLVALVIKLLPLSLYKEQTSFPVSFLSSYSNVVISPKSAITSVEKYLLSFLQLSSIFKHHIFSDEEIPILTDSRNEFSHLAQYLGLCPDIEFNNIDAMKCLMWKTPKTFITRWCNEVSTVINKNPSSSRKLLKTHEWTSPKLIQLPHEYNTLFQKYRRAKCKDCGNDVNPAICLVCGSYVCYKSACKFKELPKAGCRHANVCGKGTCILLLVNSSIVLVIRGTRACIWGTLYLDNHGEEDKGWKRGKPLYLKKERYEHLTNQWLQHSFDNTSKGWTPHSGEL